MPVSSVITLADVHAHLNIPTSDTSNDTELQGFIDAATSFITYQTGPLVPTTFTEVRNGGAPIIMLDNPPVISITSVIEYIGIVPYTLTSQPLGSTVDNYGYSLDDPVSGKLVRRSSSGMPTPFLGGQGSIVITYQAGVGSVPADVRMAALMDLQDMWQQTQQGSWSPGANDPNDQWNAGAGGMFPRLAAVLDGPGRTPSIA